MIWGLKQSCSCRQEFFNNMWHTTCTQGNQGDSRLLVIGNQIGNLTSYHNLSFGLVTKAKAYKGAGQKRSPGVACHVPGSVYNVREWTFTLPREFPLWELESLWTPESSESNFRGQNPLDWNVFYITKNLLELKCLKWVHTTHLDI